MSELPPDALERLLEDARPLLDEDGASSGALLQGRYRLQREVGRGGMGTVYEAWDEALQRRVAVKILRLGSSSRGLSADVLREARAAARLDHPGIAAVHDAFVDDQHGEAIVLQFVDGRPLSDVSHPDARTATTWIASVARAVHHAHLQGIVHRDLKPHNLMLATGEEGVDRIVVTDFGLAKETSLDTSLSLSGRVLGTPAYMPPEQAAGRAREVDATSDVYALGATLYELLAGSPPFADRDLVQLLRRIVDEEAPPLARRVPGLSRDLTFIVHTCLRKERERRYPDAQALAEDLERWLDGRPVLARPTSWSYRIGKFVARHRVPVASACALVLVTAAAWFVTTAQQARREATEAALSLSEVANAARRDAALFEAWASAGAHQGESERARARLDEGITACREFLEQYDVAAGHFLLGRLLRARRFLGEAEAALDRALELDPELMSARLERGLLRAAGAVAGDNAQIDAPALGDLSMVDFEDPSLMQVDIELGQAYLAVLREEPQDAKRGFGRVLESQDAYAMIEASFALGQLESRYGDPESAHAYAMRQIDLVRGFAPAYAQRTVDAESVSRLTESFGTAARRVPYDRAVAEKPFDAAVRAERGFHLLETGSEEEGRADLEAALYLGAAEELKERIEAALGAPQ